MTTPTISSNGQIAIPKAVRERLHLEAGTQLSIDIQGEELAMRRVVRDYPDWRTMEGMA
jgi:AbrB family looped-hinge helix DNA binding protein